jgi:hypothetical protein
MAIARTLTAAGWTLAQYDKLIDRMGLGGHAAPGVLFHWAGRTDDGLRAVDVYESREAADRLAREQIGPIAAELGLPMPEISEQAVDRFLTPPATPA